LKQTKLSRFLFFLTALLASYQVAIGVDGMKGIPIFVYTIGFGTLLVSCLMLVILGYDALENPAVAIISTIIPLSLSLGLIWDLLPNIRGLYLIFTILGLIAIILTRYTSYGKSSNFILAIVHGTAGMTIFLLPINAVLGGMVHPYFFGVSIGGGLIGIGGVLLYFYKTGNTLIRPSKILYIFPFLLFFASLAFVVGFKAYF
jgi:hypothetical protein